MSRIQITIETYWHNSTDEWVAEVGLLGGISNILARYTGKTETEARLVAFASIGGLLIEDFMCEA